MELTKQLELLKQLCEIDGVSGGEEKVADWLKNHLPEDCKVRTDALGNLICEKKGKQTPKNKLLFSAHMDEVGFIITYIEESGLLRFSSMGGIDTRVVVGKPVRLESGALGVVGAKPIHLQSASDRETVLSYDQLYIDIGAKNREDALQFAQPGDFATFRPTFIEMGSCICAKALDNRIGCLLSPEPLWPPHTALSAAGIRCDRCLFCQRRDRCCCRRRCLLGTAGHRRSSRYQLCSGCSRRICGQAGLRFGQGCGAQLPGQRCFYGP